MLWQIPIYESDGNYTFTLRNQLREHIRNVYCLVVFYDNRGNPLDVDVINYKDTIPAGLGKRVTGSVNASIKRLTTPPSRDNQYLSSFAPATKVEFRVLDFKIMD